MAFKEVLYELKTEWFQALNNQLSVPVYKDAAPISADGNYVLIRSEGSTSTEINNSIWIRSAVIVVDINTEFPVIGNSKVAYDIAQEIDDIILPFIDIYGISLANHNITQLTLQSEDELYEDDNSVKIFRLIKRFEHFLTQK